MTRDDQFFKLVDRVRNELIKVSNFGQFRFTRRVFVEGVEISSTRVVVEKVGEMATELVLAVEVLAIDRSALDGEVHSVDLNICARVCGLAMVDRGLPEDYAGPHWP